MAQQSPSPSSEPTILCVFQATEAGLECPSCGRRLDGWTGKPPFAACRMRFQQPRQPAPAFGPGTELKALLRLIGITAKPGCKCNARAREMDKMGCDWCERNITVISEWLEEEAKNRSLPYSHTAGKAIISMAIRRARKKMSDGRSGPT